jgi:phage head maturation protease
MNDSVSLADSTGETLVWFGDAVKTSASALEISIGEEIPVAGYLVRFGSPEATDVSALRDFFTADTDFGLDLHTKSRVIYQHGLDQKLDRRSLLVADLKLDDVGVWAEGQYKIRDEYDKKVAQLVKDGKLGWSSGTARHLIRREAQANGSHKITAWPLGLDASLTPAPAEPRTRAVSLKSLFLDDDVPPLGGETLADQASRTLAVLRGFAGRFDKYAQMKALENRQVSQLRRDELTAMRDSLDALLAKTVPRPSAELVAQTRRAALQFLVGIPE